MLRFLLFSVGVLSLAIPCRADVSAPAAETLIRLHVSPAPEPKPSLRYQLLPEINEMNPGNPVQDYFKCFMEQQKFFFDKAAFERREQLLKLPLKELSSQDLAQYGGIALRQADWAARLDCPDWQILLKVKTDGVALLLPDVQQIRELPNALKVRFRAEVALHRFGDAIRTAKTMFALSRHMAEHPTIVGNLVGISVANLAIGPLEEMLEQPGCPNLYWALSHLPTPLVPLDKGMGGERALVRCEFRGLEESDPMSKEQTERFVDHMDRLLGDGKPPAPGNSRVRAWLEARNKDEKYIAAARRRLVEVGLNEDRLRLLPVDQIILLDEKREYDTRIDNVMKIVNLPVWQTEGLAKQFRSAKAPAVFADALVPGVDSVRPAQARLQQRIALLRQVEALRLYAAEHDGLLPAQLSECTVPLPDDPFTGKPFRYERNGTTARVFGTPPPDEKRNANFNFVYELTVQK